MCNSDDAGVGDRLPVNNKIGNRESAWKAMVQTLIKAHGERDRCA